MFSLLLKDHLFILYVDIVRNCIQHRHIFFTFRVFVLLSDEVACVDPEMCKKACDNPIGCSNIAYPKLVLELLPEGYQFVYFNADMLILITVIGYEVIYSLYNISHWNS